MTRPNDSAIAARLREALINQPDLLYDIMQSTLQRLLEERVTSHLTAGPH